MPYIQGRLQPLSMVAAGKVQQSLEVRAGIEPAYSDLQSDTSPLCQRTIKTGAGNRTRTDDINLGKVAFYQLNYTRIKRYHWPRGLKKIREH